VSLISSSVVAVVDVVTGSFGTWFTPSFTTAGVDVGTTGVMVVDSIVGMVVVGVGVVI
jgi:hypothetical protein